MTRKIKVLFCLGFLLIILGIITNFTMSFSQDKEEVAKRMKVVNSTYEIFKKEAQDFSTTRDNLYNCRHMKLS